MVGCNPAIIFRHDLRHRHLPLGKKLFIDQYGEDAATEVAMRADAMLEKGAMAGAATWLRIVKAVEELQRQEPAPGARVY